MNRSIAAWLLSVFATCLVAGCSEGPASIADEQRIVGTWRLVSTENMGKVYESKGLIQYVFDAGMVTIINARGTSGPHAYELRPSENPAQIDITIKAENVPREGMRGVPFSGTQKGIYRFQGDSLEICICPFGGDARPSKFTSKTPMVTDLMVFERATPNEEGKKE